MLKLLYLVLENPSQHCSQLLVDFIKIEAKGNQLVRKKPALFWGQSFVVDCS